MVIFEKKLDKALKKAREIERKTSPAAHAAEEFASLSPQERKIVDRVNSRLLRGGSGLRDALATDQTDLGQVIYAIKHNRCISTTEGDLGSTYLTNVVGNAIRDIFQGHDINIVRKIFGMEPVVLTKKQKPTEMGAPEELE